MKPRPRGVKKQSPGQPSQKWQSLSKLRKSVWLSDVYASYCYGTGCLKGAQKDRQAQGSRDHWGKQEKVSNKPENSLKPVLLRFSIWTEPHSLLSSALHVPPLPQSSLSLSLPLVILRHPSRDSPSYGDGQLGYRNTTKSLSLNPSTLLPSLPNCKFSYQVKLQVQNLSTVTQSLFRYFPLLAWHYDFTCQLGLTLSLLSHIHAGLRSTSLMSFTAFLQQKVTDNCSAMPFRTSHLDFSSNLLCPIPSQSVSPSIHPISLCQIDFFLKLSSDYVTLLLKNCQCFPVAAEINIYPQIPIQAPRNSISHP